MSRSMMTRKISKNVRSTRTLKAIRGASIRSLIATAAGAVTAFACAWSGANDHSVRFNDYRTGRGFYRLPPLPIMYDAKRGEEISANQLENYDYQGARYDETTGAEPPLTIVEESDQVWSQAMAAIDSEKFGEARQLLREFLTLTHYPTIDPYEMRQVRRNSAVDLLDAMTAIDQGSRAAAIKAYFTARRAYDSPPAEVNDDLVPEARLDTNLEDNWTYLDAATLYSAGEKERALQGFTSLLARYPRSEKKEAAAYMAAKLTMESSFAFGNLKCGIEGEKPWGGPLDPSEIESKEKCRDESWHAAVESFGHLIRRYPNGRHVEDARGWLAYLYRRGGERAKALAEYYRLLGHRTNRAVRLEAKKSLQMMGHEYSDATLDEVEKLITPDVNAAMAYAYHRIYNQAIDKTYESRNDYCCYGDDRWQQDADEKERVDRILSEGRHELERVARFAAAMVMRYPHASVSGGFLLRVAEAQLELQNFNGALTFSKKALGMDLEPDLRAQALWVKGSAEHQLKEYGGAKKTFDQLIADFPKSKLVEGSRRLLAMIAEDRGDLESALQIYLDLDYESDAAYFIDVLIPTDRLAKFAYDHKELPQYNQLAYGVALRYMLEKRCNEARAALLKVPTENGTDGFLKYDKSESWYFAKEPGFDEGEFSYIKTSWVMQDLKTIDIFEHYEEVLDRAQSDEAKAEALYQLASAFFEADDLVFYNPAAWGGGRSGLLDRLLFSEHERFPNESQIVFEYMRGHDPWAHAIPIYEQIVAEYPQTKIARDALYSVAVAHERLSSRISPWTKVYERGLFAGPRLVTYADVRGTYPDYQLPRGTYGWKPSTRTVNGRPGWAPKPKPLPRQTKEHRVRRVLNEISGKLSDKVFPTVVGRVGAGVEWYGGAIKSAICGLVVGLSLWSIVWIAASFDWRRRIRKLVELAGCSYPVTVDLAEEIPKSESRVEKFIETEPD